MNIVILQHAAFENSGCIEPYLNKNGHSVSVVHSYLGEDLSIGAQADFLIVLGGPMSVHDSQQYPWLQQEQQIIKEVIAAGNWVLGICLGAQLIAAALGAKIIKLQEKEIGWFPVSQTASSVNSWLSQMLPCEQNVLHWHGERFDIPNQATRIAQSQACAEQIFVFERKAIAIQCHFEATPRWLEQLIEACSEELIEQSSTIQTPEYMRSHVNFEANNQTMRNILDEIVQQHSFELAPELVDSCHLLFETQQHVVLLNKNAVLPWFILVPKGNYTELHHMPLGKQAQLLKESQAIAQFLQSEFKADKINTAAIGNMLPQLHWHVVGRYKTDSVWPKPIWGNLTEQKEYSATQLEQMTKHLKQQLSQP